MPGFSTPKGVRTQVIYGAKVFLNNDVPVTAQICRIVKFLPLGSPTS